MRLYAIYANNEQLRGLENALPHAYMLSLNNAHIARRSGFAVVFDRSVYAKVKSDLKGVQLVLLSDLFLGGTETTEDRVIGALETGILKQSAIAKSVGCSRAYVTQVKQKLNN